MISIDRIRFVAAPPDMSRTGLVGWISLVIDGVIKLDGVTVRRKLDGGICLAWPERRDGAGRKHQIAAPIDDRARLELEAEILSVVHGQLEDAP